MSCPSHPHNPLAEYVNEQFSQIQFTMRPFVIMDATPETTPIVSGRDEHVLACWRVEDLATPNSQSVRGQYCSSCNRELWVMPRNLAIGLRLLCHLCALQRAAREGDVDVRHASELHDEPRPSA